jgi:hypothetical protein
MTKITTMVLAAVLASSSSVAFAQGAGGNTSSVCNGSSLRVPPTSRLLVLAPRQVQLPAWETATTRG